MELHLDNNNEPSYTPTKFSLLISRPSMPPESSSPPPPPQHTTVSVPFKWEEAPGKPRHCHSTVSEPDNNNNNNNVVKTLELPPRLLFLDGPSPTTVLDGPYVGRAMSFTSSYRTPRANWNSNFGSSRWSGYKKINTQDSEGIFDFSPNFTTIPRVKVTRVPRRPSFWTLSKPRSHLWASIYESFKQVVPWRRKQHTQRKCASKFDTV